MSIVKGCQRKKEIAFEALKRLKGEGIDPPNATASYVEAAFGFRVVRTLPKKRGVVAESAH